MLIHNLDPVLIDFGILQIRWYSLAYIFGILAGWMYGKVIIGKQILNKNQNDYLKNFDDLIGYIIIGVVVGGRLGYVIFYDPIFYLENISEIFKLWNGGMSFHGGFIGVIIATYIFSNFNGTDHDITVLTHEAGHAFQCYSSRNQPLLGYLWPTAHGWSYVLLL